MILGDPDDTHLRVIERDVCIPKEVRKICELERCNDLRKGKLSNVKEIVFRNNSSTNSKKQKKSPIKFNKISAIAKEKKNRPNI